ncbi:MAG: hypothetical protein ABR575_08375 [Actinomycetota bacterium]
MGIAPACGGGSEPAPGNRPARFEVTGVITTLDPPSLNDVRSFTLKAGSETYEIMIDQNVDYGFALGHLNAHRGADPVTVEIEDRGGTLFALSIEDSESP